MTQVMTWERIAKSLSAKGFRWWQKLFLMLVLVCICPQGPAAQANRGGDESGGPLVASVTHFVLPAGEASREYECVFPLPEDEWRKGISWCRRQIRVSNSLVLVEENLSRNIYYAIVRLNADPTATVRGSLYLKLWKGSSATPFPQRPPAPENLRLMGQPLSPIILFDGQGETSAFVLYDVLRNTVIWQRAFSETGGGFIDRGILRIGGIYLLEAAQGNSVARYSPPALREFRINGKPRECPVCEGNGRMPRGDESGDRWEICTECHGSGEIYVPVLEMMPSVAGNALIDSRFSLKMIRRKKTKNTRSGQQMFARRPKQMTSMLDRCADSSSYGAGRM